MGKIQKERFSLPRTFLKPKRSTAKFKPVAAIVGEAFLAYFGPIIRAHAGEDRDLGAKLSLSRAALSQDDQWNLWDPYEGKCSSHPTFFDCPGVRIRTGIGLDAAGAIGVLFADKKQGRKLLDFIRASQKENRDRECKLLSSAEMFAGWFSAFFGDWMADALAPIVGPGRRLADTEIVKLTAYLFRKNNVGVAGKDRILPLDVARQEETIRKAFVRWKNSVT